MLHHVKEANEEARAVFLSKFANNDNKVVKELTLELYGASLVGDKRHFFDGPYNADIRMSEGWRNAKSETIKNKINNADILADEFRKWLAEEFERDYAAKRLPNRMSRMHRSYKDDDDDSNAGSNKKRFGK